MPHFLDTLLRSSAPCGITIRRTGTWLAERLETALDSQARKTGLLGRDGLSAGSGLVIAPSQGIHTFGMRFPLDIVAVDRAGRVVKWRSDVPARRIVLAWAAFAMIELPAGTCRRTGLLAGDLLVVLPHDGALPPR